MSFICNICKKRCTKEIELESHMNWHATYSGEFSIKCEFCDRLFDHVQHMENHRFFVHIRQKPTVKCQLCNKVFAHKRSFLRHNKSFHLNSKEFVCVICNKGFARKEYLNKHYLMHEKECEKSFVGSINEGTNMVTKVEADSEYEDNEEIKVEKNPSETFQSLTVPRATTETAFRRKGICLKITSGRRQIAHEFEVDQNGKPDVVVENLEIEEHDGEDVKTDFRIDKTKSENTVNISSNEKRRSRSESCERIGQCLTEIKSKDSAKGKGCRSSSNVKNECLKKLTKKFGSVTYIDEFVHDPNFESGTTESKDEGLKNSSGISSDVEISQKEHKHHKVDQSAMESPTNEECQLLKTKKPYSYVEGLNRIVANHMKIPLYVDLDINNATTSAANRSESEVCKGKGSKRKGSCGNVERKVRTEIEEFSNERRTSNMADQSKSQGKFNIKLASWPELNPKEVRDPKKHICTDKTCVERCRRNRKSNLDCWKRATGTNNIKVSSYSNASVDVVEYASSDILVVECFRDVGSDVSKDKTQAGKEDNEELCTDPCDDVRVMNVKKNNNDNKNININKQNVNDKRKSPCKNVKESETEVINLIEDEDVKDTLSDEKLHADNQLHGRKAENVEPLKQNEAYVTKQIVNFDETRKNCQSVKHDVQENKPMYRNHVVGDLIGPYTITDADVNCKGLDLSIKGKTKINTSKSSEITSYGNMPNSTIREENQNSKCNVEKQMLFNGFIDKTNQRRNNGPRSVECDKNKTSVILPVFMKGIAADRKFNADKDCIIIEDAGVNEACLDKLLTENSSKGMTDNLKDLDKFLNWSVELNDSNDKSQEKDLNNRAIENRQKNAVSIVNAKLSSVDIEKRGGFCETAGIVDNEMNNSEETVNNNDTTSDGRNQLRASKNSPKTDLLKTEHDCHNIDVEDGLSVGHQTAFQVIVKDDIDDESHSIMHNTVLPRFVVEDCNTKLQNETKIILGSSNLPSPVKKEAENDIESKSKNFNTSDQNSGTKRETISFPSTAGLSKCDDESTVLTDIASDGETEKNKCSVCYSSSVNYVCEHDKVVDVAQSDNDENNVESKQDAGNKVDLAQDESHNVASSKQCGKRKCYVLCTRVEDEERARKKMLLGLKKGKHGDSPHIVRVTKEGMIVDVTDEYQQYLPDNSE